MIVFILAITKSDTSVVDLDELHSDHCGQIVLYLD